MARQFLCLDEPDFMSDQGFRLDRVLDMLTYHFLCLTKLYRESKYVNEQASFINRLVGCSTKVIFTDFVTNTLRSQIEIRVAREFDRYVLFKFTVDISHYPPALMTFLC